MASFSSTHLDDNLSTKIALSIGEAIMSPFEELRVAMGEMVQAMRLLHVAKERRGHGDNSSDEEEGCRRLQDRGREKAYANLLTKKLKQKEQSSCLEAVHLDENKSGSMANQSQVRVPSSYKDDCEHNFGDYIDVLELDSPLDALQSVVSFRQTNLENVVGLLSVHKLKQTSGPDWEDDGTEGTTRIPKVIIPENGVHCSPYAGRGMGCGNPANNSKGSSLILKGEKMSMIMLVLMCPEDMDDKSFLHPGSHVEESTLTCFTLVYLSSTAKKFHTDMVGRGSNLPIEGQVTLRSKEGLDETGFSIYLCQLDSIENTVESSNGRHFLETSVACTALMHGIAFEDKVHSSEELKTKKVSNNTYEEPVSSEKGEQQLNHFLFPDVLHRDSFEESNVQVFDDGQHLRQVNSLPRIEAEVEDLQCQEEPDQYILERNTGPFSSGHFWARRICRNISDNRKFTLRVPKIVTPVARDLSDSGWFDVSLDVQATYQGEHVPLVSLMSRLNGKAIVGHPVTIEILEDGYCDALFADYNFMREPFVNYQSAGVVNIGQLMHLDGGYCCASYGRFKELHDIVVKAARTLEEEVGPINGKVEVLLSRISPLGTGLRLTTEDSLPAACRGRELTFPMDLTCVLPRTPRRALVSNLQPCTEYAFKIVSFTNTGDVGHTEAKCFTKSVEVATDAWEHMDTCIGDVVAWPTNLGWMMGPWLAYASLLNGASMALYNGSSLGYGFTKSVQNAKLTMLGLVPSIASSVDEYLWLVGRAYYKPVIEYCRGTEIGGGFVAGSMLQAQSLAMFNTPAMGCTLFILGEDDNPIPETIYWSSRMGTI
eukprot:Gb_24789 [translate_table: standard]